MSSTISTSRPSIEASRSFRMRTTPLVSVDDPYEATAMKSSSHGTSIERSAANLRLGWGAPRAELEHVEDDRRALREMVRVLKPGGTALLLVPIVLEMVAHL